jgi:transposase
VAQPSKVRLITASMRKSDRADAQLLARLGRMDPRLLYPVHHRGPQSQAHRALLGARDALVRTRTVLVNHCRGTVKGFGERLPSEDP